MVLFENYIAGDDAAANCYGVNWVGQSFTLGDERHSVTSIKLKLLRVGAAPGTMTVSVRLTANPTGADLTSGTYNAATISDAAAEWIEVNITEYVLERNLIFSIVIRCLTGDASNHIHVSYDDTSSTFANGSMLTSADSGASWSALADDIMFEVNGNDHPHDYTLDSIDNPSLMINLGADMDQAFTPGTETDLADGITYDAMTWGQEDLPEDWTGFTVTLGQIRTLQKMWVRSRSRVKVGVTNLNSFLAALPSEPRLRGLEEYKIIGVTVDQNEAPLAAADVFLLRGDFRGYSLCQKTISDGSGNYLFYVDDPSDDFVVLSWKWDAGLGEYIRGVTDRDLNAVAV